MPRRSYADRLAELVRSEPGISVSEASRKLGVSKSTVSTLSKLLEGRGLVRRVRRGPLVLLYPVESRTGMAPSTSRRIRLGIIRAAEYPFTAAFAKVLRDQGIALDVVVYDNGLDATFDLVVGSLDLALTPLATQALFYGLTSRLKIIGGGASGGAYVLENPEARRQYVATTRASTMELCVNVSGVAGEASVIVYGSSGEEIVEALATGRARYAAVWEPYASQALRHGARIAVSCSELGISHCCTLAARADLDWELRARVSRAYARAIEEFLRRPRDWLPWYSAVVGLPVELVERSLASYSFRSTVDGGEAAKMLARSGMRIPNPDLVREAVEQG
ncbi:MAG: MarR family transcriptional regulator [Thermoproteota archaeon]